MAAADFLDILRLLIAESTEDNFTDAELIQILVDNTDGVGFTDLDSAAATVWEMKAARYSTLVDITEAGSSRKLSDLSKNALAMVVYYRKKAQTTPEAEAVFAPRSRAIIRPQ